MRGRVLTLTLLLLVAGTLFRVAILRSYISTSPDGTQYYQLSQQLVRSGRYALAPPPAPLTYARLPGYPIFLALLAGGGALTLPDNVFRATLANTALDLVTGLLLLWIARRLALPAATGYFALALLLLCPLMFLFASYSLTESLATCLGMLAFAAALRARQSGAPGWAFGCGVAMAAALLVRADMVTELPALAIVLWRRGQPATPRLRVAGALLAGLLLLLSPWALRNWARFGAPHLTGAEWPTQDGEPLRTGPMQWMRTWAAGRPGDGDLSGKFIFRERFTPEQWILPRMYGSPQERAELLSILDDYRQHGLTEAVDARFVQLARARARAHPLLVYLQLPLARAQRLFATPPRGDYPLRVGFLGLPARRELVFGGANLVVYVLALAGALLWWRAAERRWALAAVLAALAARTLLHMWAVPTFVCQRYLIEVMPLLLLLAATPLGWLSARVTGRAHA